MIKLLASRVHQIFKILDIWHLCVCRGYSKIMCSSILNSTKKVALHGNTCAYLSTLVHRFAHLMSHSGVQFLSTTWSSAQDEQKAHIEVSCLLENENLGWHGSHVTNALEFIGCPHSSERPCPGRHNGQSSHKVEPSEFSTQYWVPLQGFVRCKTIRIRLAYSKLI